VTSKEWLTAKPGTYEAAMQVAAEFKRELEQQDAEIARLQSNLDAAIATAKRREERLRKDMDRAYMRLQCADVPRGEPWHWEVCDTMLTSSSDETNDE